MIWLVCTGDLCKNQEIYYNIFFIVSVFILYQEIPQKYEYIKLNIYLNMLVCQ